MCWVIPPASPSATRVERIRSNKDVFPWSTCPMMVTIGERFSKSDSSISSSLSKSSSSKVASSTSTSKSAARSAAVSPGMTWLMVAMVPSSIIFFRMLVALMPIKPASSPMVTWLPILIFFFLGLKTCLASSSPLTRPGSPFRSLARSTFRFLGPRISEEE